MNRTQRRAAAKKGITADELRNLYLNTAHDVTQSVVQGYSVALAMVLHDKWGFGRTRLRRCLQQVSVLFEDINSGLVSIEDCEKILLEECNIEIKEVL